MTSAPVTDSNVELYLNATGNGRLWTVNTWLHHNLQGRAKEYSWQYYNRMALRLQDMLEAGEVECVRSAGGGTAFVRKADRE